MDSNTSTDELYDLAIIGAGPVGQYAAYYAGLRGMKTLVIDSLSQLGGQLSALYPEKYIFDVAGFPQIYSKDLVQNLTDQMMQYDLNVQLNQKVTELVPEGDILNIATDKGLKFQASTAIVSAGRGAFTPRKIDLSNLADLEGKGVHYFITDKAKLKGKKLMIVGGGDSAFDWALNLSDVAESITLIHRSDQFRAHHDTIVKVLEMPVKVHTFHEVKAIHGDEHVQGVTIYHNKTMEETQVECDHLLLNLGFLANLGPIKQWGLELHGNYIKVNSRMETNIPRVYSAGDIVIYDGKLPLISTGFGDAATAVNHAYALIHPGAKIFPGHSSEQVPEKK